MADQRTDLPESRPVKHSGTLIGIGVTGHRLSRLDTSILASISASVGQVLDQIAKALATTDAASLRLISALADGADSIVTDEAIARCWTVDAVIPFPRDDYAADFAEGEARAAYRQRLAKFRSVLELPGSRAQAGGIAYERAGRVVLAQCDVLVAVWDGGPGPWPGRGGAHNCRSCASGHPGDPCRCCRRASAALAVGRFGRA